MSTQTLFANAGAETQHDLFARITERNRQNARHSTGPRTPEGKLIACKNALKRGYSLTTHQILNNESPEAYNQMLHDLQQIFHPQSPREHLAVLEIAHCKWALRRLDLAEVTLLNNYTDNPETMSREEGDDVTGGESIGYLAILRDDEPPPLEFKALDLIHRYRRPWDRRHQEALREYDRAVIARQRAEERQLKLELLKQKLAAKQAPPKKQEAPQKQESHGELEREAAAILLKITQATEHRTPTPFEQELLDLASGFVPQPEVFLQNQHTTRQKQAANG